MKSKSRKYLGVLLAALLAIALVPMSALAVEPTNKESGEGSITISKAKDKQTYTIYRILDIDQYNTEAGTYYYKANQDWIDFLNTEANNVIKPLEGDGPITGGEYLDWYGDSENDPDVVKNFADAAFEFAKGKKDLIVSTTTADGDTVRFENLPLGYYLVDSGMGTVCALNATTPDVSITEKNTEPKVEKKVKENSNSQWQDKNDASLGEVVEFRSTITVGKGAIGYVFHDKMEGLTLVDGSVRVVKYSNDADLNNENGATATAGTDYTLAAPGATHENGACAFEVTFTDTYCRSLSEGEKLVVYYNATVNQDAVIADTGNPNECWLKYGENSSSESNHDDTKTYTWKFGIFKFSNKGVALSGVEFELTKGEPKGAKLGFSQENGVYKAVKEVSDDNTVLSTDEGGFISIEGLDEGIYYLHETKAPEGYNALAKPIEIKITHNLEATPDASFGVEYDGSLVDADEFYGKVPVENKSGLQLPSTGGIGTTIFYVGGGILVIGAIVYLVTRRRAKSSK